MISNSPPLTPSNCNPSESTGNHATVLAGLNDSRDIVLAGAACKLTSRNILQIGHMCLFESIQRRFMFRECRDGGEGSSFNYSRKSSDFQPCVCLLLSLAILNRIAQNCHRSTIKDLCEQPYRPGSSGALLSRLMFPTIVPLAALCALAPTVRSVSYTLPPNITNALSAHFRFFSSPSHRPSPPPEPPSPRNLTRQLDLHRMLHVR